MNVLGIESTAHTLGAGIATTDEILSSERAQYEPDEGGIHPREAAEHHYAHALDVYHRALDAADMDEDDIDAVAFAQGPGIPRCLQIGGVLARSLAQKLDVPLVGVNHPVAHLEVARLATGFDRPVMLYVSGGNTQVIARAAGRYRVFGETLDIAIGNALDKFARSIGIPHPGGPEIEELAADGDELIELPYSVKGMDVSFSGMVTDLKQRSASHDHEDLAYSFQEHAFAMLVEVTERAMAHLGVDEVVVTGGVAANGRLQEMLDQMAEDRGAEFREVPLEYCMDNGAMIAYAGALKHDSGEETALEDSGVRPDWRTDEEDITWD